jgi:hypothetical protein
MMQDYVGLLIESDFSSAILAFVSWKRDLQMAAFVVLFSCYALSLENVSQLLLRTREVINCSLIAKML